MYIVKRISVTDRCSDGQPIYEQQWTYPTWRAMMADMSQRYSQFHALCGLGSDIFCHDTRLGNAQALNQIDKPFGQITRREFCDQVAENEEPAQ